MEGDDGVEDIGEMSEFDSNRSVALELPWDPPSRVTREGWLTHGVFLYHAENQLSALVQSLR
jgi:hypothetical protein